MRFARPRWWVLVLAVSCRQPPAPTCKEVVENASVHFRIDPEAPADQEAMETLLPFDHRMGGSDVAYPVGKCEIWSTDYRRCVSSAFSQGDFVSCNQGDDTKTFWADWV